MSLKEIRNGREYIHQDDTWLSGYHWHDMLGIDPRLAIKRSGSQTKREPIPNNYEGYGIRIVTPVSDFPKFMAELARGGRHPWLRDINFSQDFELYPPSVTRRGLKYEYPKS